VEQEARAVSFEGLWDAELDEISLSRTLRQERTAVAPPVPAGSGRPSARAHDAALAGLAFSGGGIRSATFNLGVLQGLAQHGLLRRFDYLSTVSGGGYIGSWLGAWIRREGIAAVERGLAPRPAEGGSAAEHEAVRALRRYSNYLTPRLGVFSADTWTMISIYLRNLVLNQGILILALAAVLLMARPLAGLTRVMAENPEVSLIAAWALLGCALVSTGINLRALYRKPAEGKYPSYCGPTCSMVSIVLPVLLASWATAAGIWGLEDTGELFRRVNPAAAPFHVTTFGTPLLVFLISFAATGIIGLWGPQLADEKREWVSWIGGWLMIACVAWVAFFAMAFYSPLIFLNRESAMAELARRGFGPVWLMTTAAGLLAGHSASTGQRGSNRWLEFVAVVAPFVFIGGLLALLALAIHQAHLYFVPPDLWSYWGQMAWPLEPGRRMAALGVSLGATSVLAWLALFLSSRVDINQFSMHMFYRNRLVRCYLGASSHGRRPHPITGFSVADDDMPIWRLAPSLVETGQDGAARGYSGPYPIVNAALNLTHGEELAWQQRKASSFVFTPRFCGFEVPPVRKDVSDFRADSVLAPAGYRPSGDYAYPNEGVTLGTALAISGAAASPNMGYHTSSATAFLMTVFNVRLGWWLSNPRHNVAWRVRGPRLGLKYLFGELLGLTNDRSPYVYVSDGGHFENLAVYELVRRRCRFIVACDGSEDGKCTFEGLGNAIEKCRADFGVPIEVDFEQLRPAEGQRTSEWHCAVGRIRYDLVDPQAPVGTLLYLKASLTGDEPGDVKRYAAENLDFPNQPTSDQWFDESQFESYRALGEHVATSVFGAVEEAQQLSQLSNEDLFLALRQRWYPAAAIPAGAFAQHATAVDRIIGLIRSNPELAFLDAQIYPEWQRLMNANVKAPPAEMWLPREYTARRAGFYACTQMIQLMESVYLDLNLEDAWDHPDNRGWMNLFQHWAWSGMFRVTWAIVSSTFGARFQNFCRKHLSLDIRRDVLVGPPMPLEEAQRSDTLNFFEKELLEQFVEQNAQLGADAVYPLHVIVDDPMRKTEDVAFLFTFGFALAGTVDGQTALLYFRIQNHLRKMGLPREALAQLISNLDIQQTRLGLLRRDDDEAVTPEKRRQFAQLFETVKAEVTHGRTSAKG
jgi:Patatin-like phospholipase